MIALIEEVDGMKAKAKKLKLQEEILLVKNQLSAIKVLDLDNLDDLKVRMRILQLSKLRLEKKIACSRLDWLDMSYIFNQQVVVDALSKRKKLFKVVESLSKFQGVDIPDEKHLRTAYKIRSLEKELDQKSLRLTGVVNSLCDVTETLKSFKVCPIKLSGFCPEVLNG